MNRMIVTAVAAAVAGLASVAAQAAPPSGGTASVTVVNTAAAPVPTTVQNTVGVDVLSGPATRARLWKAGCTISTGAYFCDWSSPVQAPAGMVMRVVGVSGVVNAGCTTDTMGSITLSGAFQAPGAAVASARIMVTGTMLQRASRTTTVLDWSGNAFFTAINEVQFALMEPAVSCGFGNGGEISVHYVLEPLA